MISLLKHTQIQVVSMCWGQSNATMAIGRRRYRNVPIGSCVTSLRVPGSQCSLELNFENTRWALKVVKRLIKLFRIVPGRRPGFRSPDGSSKFDLPRYIQYIYNIWTWIFENQHHWSFFCISSVYNFFGSESVRNCSQSILPNQEMSPGNQNFV